MLICLKKKLKQYHRKEALTIAKSLERFEPYLCENFRVYSNHNPRKFIETMKIRKFDGLR